MLSKEERMKYIRKVQQDPYRLHYHLMPPMGSLADPNGMCQIDDTYHIYYVYNPKACLSDKRTACVWGHYTTQDFIHFQNEDIAIYPDHPSDRDGVYSGSSLYVDKTLHVFYTGNVRYQGDYDYIVSGREQNVLKVSSQDGIHFHEKTLLMTNDDFPGNMTKHVRDPQVFFEDGKYYMVLGARHQEDRGLVLIYESQDMIHWTYQNELTTSKTFGYMWECPDLIVLDKQRILIACPQGVLQDGYCYQNSHQCGYFEVIGDFRKDAILSEFQQFDYGFDFYAARTFLNQAGQRILIGWLGMSEASYSKNQTYQNGWQQALAMPRVLTYKNHHIYQQPIKQMQDLRYHHKTYHLQNGLHKNSLCFELIITFMQDVSFHMRLREDCLLTYHKDEHMLILKMNQCGDGRTMRSVKVEQLEKLQIFSDTSSLEIFINDGYYTMSSRIFGLSDKIIIENVNAQAEFYELSQYQMKW